MRRWAWVVLLAAVCGGAVAANRVEQLTIAGGQGVSRVPGRVQGYDHVDYRLTAHAGQTLRVRIETRHGANYFNVLPPGAADVAMFAGGAPDNAFEGVLPADGVYQVRVYLMRAAARRHEAARYRLSVELAGTPLPPLAAERDALVSGTSFHAQATVPCAPAYLPVDSCAAGVVRRGRDGTATVELRWGSEGLRRLLFIQGRAVSADAAGVLQVRRQDDWTIVEFEDGSRFEIPDALLFGG